MVLLFSACSDNKKQEGRQKAPRGKRYVCSGKYAKSYHIFKDCMGLQRCSGDIIEVDIEDIDSSKKLCGFCKGDLSITSID